MSNVSSTKEPIRVFIGSGEASRLERKVLIHSLRKNCTGPLEVFVMNGTHDAIEKDDEAPYPAGMPLSIKYRNVTEFSNYRFLIPRLAGGVGRAIYVDSDMICLKDMRELLEAPLADHAFLAKPAAYGGSSAGAPSGNDGADRTAAAPQGPWGLSVMLIDCARASFDLDTYFEEIAAGLYSYDDLHRMTPRFLERHPFSIGAIDPRWNEFDRYDDDTRLIHYTNLFTQPWKFTGHRAGPLWFQYFEEARAAGVVTEEDIHLSLARAMVRQNLLEGNSPSIARAVARRVKRLLSSTVGTSG